MREVAARPLRHEPALVYFIVAMLFGAIPLSLGYMGLSWDALNHHIYLGWTAEHPRFNLDYVPAGYQAYQFPYLYWPFYKLATTGFNGATAGFILAMLHTLAIPPVWMMARSTITGDDAFAAGMRFLAVVLAFMSGAILSLFDSTSNDLLASIPLLWSYALALRAADPASARPWQGTVASGAFAGLAVACKLSNGFLVLALPVLWLATSGSALTRFGRCVAAGAAVLAAFGLAYGYWGWQLWTHFGNPIYPFADDLFEPVRAMAGWQP